MELASAKTTISAFALAIRFVPAHRHGWSLSALAILSALGLVALFSSAYVIYTLEIIKLHRLRALRGGRTDPAHASVDRPAGALISLWPGLRPPTLLT